MAVAISSAEDVNSWDGKTPFYFDVKLKKQKGEDAPEMRAGETERIEKLEALMVERLIELQEQTSDNE